MFDDSRLYLRCGKIDHTRYDCIVRVSHSVLCLDAYAVLSKYDGCLRADGSADELSGAWKSFAADKDIVEWSELYCFFWCAYNV